MFRRLSLAAAAAALLASPAQAVSLDPGGLGQALIYPYYTVRAVGGNAFNTYLSIVNTTQSAKALRVRFRDGAAGDTALEFNLFLSATDMWTGALVPETNGARLVSSDRSCTSPGSVQVSLGSSTEGYVEVFEMGTLTGAAAAAVTQDASGVPFNCAVVQAPNVLPAGQIEAPTGGLTGTLTLINVPDGRDYTVNATALAGLASTAYYRAAGNPYPGFNAAEISPVSHVVADGHAYTLNWSSGLQAVSSVLMAADLENELVFDPGTASRTEWVITMPTRLLHVSGTASAPFKSTTCQNISYALFSRERAADYPLSNPVIADPPPRACHSSAVVAFELESIPLATELGSEHPVRRVSTGFVRFPNGRARLTFDAAPLVSLLSTRRDLRTGAEQVNRYQVAGLPAIGFMVRSFTNGTFACGASNCQSTFGGAFPHVTVRRITVSP
jgi:hypothetical protein